MGHTPGKWTLFDRLVQGRDGAPVAAVHGPHAYANARLIAAAPELLECCYRLLQIVEVEYEADPEPEDLDTWREAIQLAADCIAKAEGRSER